MDDSIKEFIDKIKEINVFNLGENDSIVFKFDFRRLSPTKTAKLAIKYRDTLQEIFPNNKVLIFNEDVQIEIIKN